MTMTDDTDTMKLDPKIHVEMEAFLCAHFFRSKEHSKKDFCCVYTYLTCKNVQGIQNETIGDST